MSVQQTSEQNRVGTGPGGLQGVSERIQIGGIQTRALATSVAEGCGWEILRGFMEGEDVCQWPVMGVHPMLPSSPAVWLTPIGIIQCAGDATLLIW